MHQGITEAIPHSLLSGLPNPVYKYCVNNNSDLPEGWAMPDDLAKKVSEALNRKSITPEDELADVLV